MSAPQLPVALIALVTVLIDGNVTPAAPPARLVDGHVIAPVALVARFADRVETFADGGVLATRGDRACDARSVDGMVAVAPLARCLGAELAWDGRAKTIALSFPQPSGVRTHAPYDPNAPRVAPTTIFTPEPSPPTPRAIETGIPRPRRTGVPEEPTFPFPTTSPFPPARGSRPKSL